MPPIAKLYITRWAFALIEREARSYIARSGVIENETGGILIGRRIAADQVVILAATGPGPKAEIEPFVFSPDIGYANNRLRDYHIAYPDADYVGTWHKHPLNSPAFSGGDLDTARKILRDRAYKLDELFCPIVWVDQQQIYLNCYYLDRALLRARQPFQTIPGAQIELIADSHPLLTRERTSPQPLLKLRLNEERDFLLGAGYTVLLSQDNEQQTFIMEVSGARLGQRTVIFEISPDYPHHPPIIVVEQPGQQPRIANQILLKNRSAAARQPHRSPSA